VHAHAEQIGLGQGYAAHSMRATVITIGLDNGAKLEDVQQTVGHTDPSTIQPYDRRRLFQKNLRPYWWNIDLLTCVQDTGERSVGLDWRIHDASPR
jgi:site-specific recombinase XerD